MQGEAIYKGATRPPMKFGVPLVPLVILVGTGILVTIWGAVLVSWWVPPIVLITAAPTFAWMRFVTRRDDQRFRQMFLALKLRSQDRNRAFWKSSSYAPYPYRKATTC